MFAAITPALITGAFAERKRFASFVIFTVLWSLFVYSPIAHWVWASDGWLYKLGALDFAGGTVVHASSGLSALVVALLIGRRAVNGERMEPHDIPMTVLGAGLLWFGWFGFNAGSALTAGGLAANALVVTNTAAAAATISWVLIAATAPAQGQRRRRGVRGGRRARRDHARVGLRHRRRRARDRSRRGRAVLQRHAAPGAPPDRRRARRLLGPRRRRRLRRAGDGGLRHDGDQRVPGLIDGNPGQIATQAIAVGATSPTRWSRRT